MMYTPHHQSLKAFQLDLSTGEIPILDAGASVRNASRLSGIVEDQKWQLSSLALRDQSPLHGSEISINVIRPGMYYVSYIIANSYFPRYLGVYLCISRLYLYVGNGNKAAVRNEMHSFLWSCKVTSSGPMECPLLYNG